ncbi:MAG: hypothetical protein WBC91_26585 [Phototrophicaceae bacterium]
MSSNVDAMVRAGVDAYRAGNKLEARTLLERAIEIDGYNETAWLWLSAVVETKEEQQTCLENVLIINPDNSRAIQGLKSLGVDPATVLAAQQDDVVEANTFDDAFDVDSFANPFEGGDDLFKDSSQSDDVADDLFGDIDFSDDGGAFGIDDNIFNDDVFGDDEDDALFDDDISYDNQALFTDDISYDATSYDDALFDDGDDMFADMTTLENYNDAVGDNSDYDETQFAIDPFAPPPPPPPPKPPAPEPLTSEQLLAQIPSEIKATRAPGVSETVPQIHYILLGVLAVVNVGALVFIGLQFAG